MKTEWQLVAVATVLIVGGFCGCYLWKTGQPRRDAVQTLTTLSDTLHSKDTVPMLKIIVPPRALVGETRVEQENFLSKALQSEVSQACTRRSALENQKAVALWPIK